jgi:sec-independent protein translocase protein TatA
MPTPGPVELIIILIIAIVFIGPGRLPDVGAALGKSIREFRKASTDISEATRTDAPPPAPAAPAPAAQTAAPAPTPEPSVPTPTASTVPAPVAAPADPRSEDEPTNLPA